VSAVEADAMCRPLAAAGTTLDLLPHHEVVTICDTSGVIAAIDFSFDSKPLMLNVA